MLYWGIFVELCNGEDFAFRDVDMEIRDISIFFKDLLCWGLNVKRRISLAKNTILNSESLIDTSCSQGVIF